MRNYTSQQLGEEAVENPVTPTHRQLVEFSTSDIEGLPFSCHLGEELLGCNVPTHRQILGVDTSNWKIYTLLSSR